MNTWPLAQRLREKQLQSRLHISPPQIWGEARHSHPQAGFLMRYAQTPTSNNSTYKRPLLGMKHTPDGNQLI